MAVQPSSRVLPHRYSPFRMTQPTRSIAFHHVAFAYALSGANPARQAGGATHKLHRAQILICLASSELRADINPFRNSCAKYYFQCMRRMTTCRFRIGADWSRQKQSACHITCIITYRNGTVGATARLGLSMGVWFRRGHGLFCSTMLIVRCGVVARMCMSRPHLGTHVDGCGVVCDVVCA